MKYKKIKERHDKLELDVFTSLIKEIENSKTDSQHVNTKAIKVNVFDYEEMIYINDALTFLDGDGYHYGVYSECSLEDLIDILTKL